MKSTKPVTIAIHRNPWESDACDLWVNGARVITAETRAVCERTAEELRRGPDASTECGELAASILEGIDRCEVPMLKRFESWLFDEHVSISRAMDAETDKDGRQYMLLYGKQSGLEAAAGKLREIKEGES